MPLPASIRYIGKFVFCSWTVMAGDGPAKKPKIEDGQKGGGQSQPLPLSHALRDFLNTDETSLPRAEVVKRVWDYVKEHNLQVSRVVLW